MRLESWLQDARYALRLLRRSPIFAATAALSLAIGIGANVTIFSVASALLLRPLPGLADPSRLVDVGRTQGGEGFDTVSYPYYRDVRDRTRTLSGVYALELEPRAVSLGGRGEAERIYGTLVTANYFGVLGTRAAAGRLLQAQDDEGGGRQVAVISYQLWQRRFAGSPDIVGQTIVLNGSDYGVVGVAPRGFQGTTLLRSDVWVPITTLAAMRRPGSLLDERRSVWLFMGGRLADGATPAQADAELRAIGAALEREYPRENRGKGLTVAASAIVPGQVRLIGGFIGLLMAIVAVVLLIACINIAGMLLARAAARRREIAVRMAIGAGRARLVRQMLVETVVLFSAGGLAGLLLSKWLTSLLLAVLPQLPVPIAFDITLDWRVVTFAVLASLAAALVAGIAPALQASRPNVVPALKSEGLDAGPSRLRLRNAFVVGQVALSLLLIVAAGLLLRSLQHAADVQPGFDQHRVDVATVDLSLAGYTDATGRAFLRDWLARVRALPAVEQATVSRDLPLDGGRFGLGGIRIPGVTEPGGGDLLSPDWNISTPGLFATLRIPIVRGRDFSDTDVEGSLPVAIVNDAFVRRYLAGREPIGTQFRMDGPRTGAVTVTIVGVAADARLMSLGEAAEPYVSVPLDQYYNARVSLLVRRAGEESLIPQVRAIVRELNPNLPLSEAMPLTEITAIGLVPQRIAASVAGALGLVGLLLAAIGIYGVTSYAVSHRTREIGIRVALGASHTSVLRLILRQGLTLAAFGVALGVLFAAAGSRLLENLLFGVQGLDPFTFAAACLLFIVVSLVATYLPARRAALVDPMAALRAD